MLYSLFVQKFHAVLRCLALALLALPAIPALSVLLALTANAADNAHHVNPIKAATDSVALPEYLRQKTQVAISNYPLFLLSEVVTKGAPSGILLLNVGDIGHHGGLSPSDMKTIKNSRYVVWFGDSLETNLTKTLATKNNTISLYGLKGFNRQPRRDVQGKPIANTLDPHIWLDPNNAKAITRALGAIYSRANPAYQQRYAANVQAFATQMDAAVAQVAKPAKSTKLRPYWAYHDAFQYIEPTLKLEMVGALTTDHHLPPKASQMRWLNNNRPQKTLCVLLQTDSNQGVLNKLAPVKSSVQQEDMGNAQDFVTGWLTMVTQINRCIQTAASAS